MCMDLKVPKVPTNKHLGNDRGAPIFYGSELQ